jgi:hypothetical protein
VVAVKHCIRQHTSAYVSIRQHTSAYVSIRQQVEMHLQQVVVAVKHCIRQHTSAYVSIRQHTSAYVSRSRCTSSRLWLRSSTDPMQLLRCQYLYFCTGTASTFVLVTLRSCMGTVFVLLYWYSKFFCTSKTSTLVLAKQKFT